MSAFQNKIMKTIDVTNVNHQYVADQMMKDYLSVMTTEIRLENPNGVRKNSRSMFNKKPMGKTVQQHHGIQTSQMKDVNRRKRRQRENYMVEDKDIDESSTLGNRKYFLMQYVNKHSQTKSSEMLGDILNNPANKPVPYVIFNGKNSSTEFNETLESFSSSHLNSSDSNLICSGLLQDQLSESSHRTVKSLACETNQLQCDSENEFSSNFNSPSCNCKVMNTTSDDVLKTKITYQSNEFMVSENSPKENHQNVFFIGSTNSIGVLKIQPIYISNRNIQPNITRKNTCKLYTSITECPLLYGTGNGSLKQQRSMAVDKLSAKSKRQKNTKRYKSTIFNKTVRSEVYKLIIERKRTNYRIVNKLLLQSPAWNNYQKEKMMQLQPCKKKEAYFLNYKFNAKHFIPNYSLPGLLEQADKLCLACGKQSSNDVNVPESTDNLRKVEPNISSIKSGKKKMYKHYDYINYDLNNCNSNSSTKTSKERITASSTKVEENKARTNISNGIDSYSSKTKIHKSSSSSSFFSKRKVGISNNRSTSYLSTVKENPLVLPIDTKPNHSCSIYKFESEVVNSDDDFQMCQQSTVIYTATPFSNVFDTNINEKIKGYKVIVEGDSNKLLTKEDKRGRKVEKNYKNEQTVNIIHKIINNKEKPSNWSTSSQSIKKAIHEELKIIKLMKPNFFHSLPIQPPVKGSIMPDRACFIIHQDPLKFVPLVKDLNFCYSLSNLSMIYLFNNSIINKVNQDYLLIMSESNLIMPYTDNSDPKEELVNLLMKLNDLNDVSIVYKVKKNQYVLSTSSNEVMHTLLSCYKLYTKMKNTFYQFGVALEKFEMKNPFLELEVKKVTPHTTYYCSLYDYYHQHHYKLQPQSEEEEEEEEKRTQSDHPDTLSKYETIDRIISQYYYYDNINSSLSENKLYSVQKFCSQINLALSVLLKDIKNLNGKLKIHVGKNVKRLSYTNEVEVQKSYSIKFINKNVRKRFRFTLESLKTFVQKNKRDIMKINHLNARPMQYRNDAIFVSKHKLPKNPSVTIRKITALHFNSMINKAQNIIYFCNDCRRTFNSESEWNRHKKIYGK